jgi:hypothetical protein
VGLSSVRMYGGAQQRLIWRERNPESVRPLYRNNGTSPTYVHVGTISTAASQFRTQEHHTTLHFATTYRSHYVMHVILVLSVDNHGEYK